MTALTESRNTLARGNVDAGRKDEFPVANAVTIYQGAMLVINATGFVAPATTATGLIALGRSSFDYPLSTSDGEFLIESRAGTFAYVSATGGGDDITAANKGALCYIVDDQTVALTDGGGTRSVAGYIYNVDSDGVWVLFSYPFAA